MIFVTVGTHEQQFNRLLQEMDRLVKENLIEDEVFIQSGYSDYTPKYCSYSKFLPYQEMEKCIEKADIVITHGGPASFMKVLSVGKIPIVVPRLSRFGEHVNDHQLEFIHKVLDKNYEILDVEDISDLYKKIKQVDCQKKIIESRNIIFMKGFSTNIKKLMES